MAYLYLHFHIIRIYIKGLQPISQTIKNHDSLLIRFVCTFEEVGTSNQDKKLKAQSRKQPL